METIGIAWAAGLYEGEGSICLSKGSLRCKMSSTDEDVVMKLRSVMGGHKTGPYLSRNGLAKKPHWVWGIYGADARRAITALYPYLGARRRAQVDACFAQLETIHKERISPRPCRICGTMFTPENPKYASRTFYCKPSCKSRVSNGYVVAKIPRTRFLAPKT